MSQSVHAFNICSRTEQPNPNYAECVDFLKQIGEAIGLTSKVSPLLVNLLHILLFLDGPLLVNLLGLSWPLAPLLMLHSSSSSR